MPSSKQLIAQAIVEPQVIVSIPSRLQMSLALHTASRFGFIIIVPKTAMVSYSGPGPSANA